MKTTAPRSMQMACLCSGVTATLALMLPLSLIVPVLPLQAQTPAQPSPRMQAVLDRHARLKPEPIEQLKPREARQQPSIQEAANGLAKQLGEIIPEPVAEVEEETYTSEGTELDLRIYIPPGDGPFPTVLYIHGGGWVLGDLDTYDATARSLCNAAGVVVVAPSYRHAPEHRFPAAHADMLAAYKWLLEHAAEHRADPSRIALVGESAGGNMAAGLSLMIAQARLPQPLHQVLVYPVTDLSRMDTPSYEEHAQARPLNAAMMRWFTQYLIRSSADVTDPMLSIAHAGRALAVSPPTTIITAEIDPLRSDGDKLAAALREQGVPVTLENYPGVTHEFFGMARVVPAARQAVSLAANQINGAFAAALRARETAAR